MRILLSRTGLRLCSIVLAITVAPLATAQQQNRNTPPHIGFAYPAGGKQGTTLTVSVGGQNLDGTTDAYVSGAGITARVVSFDRPLSQKEYNDIRDKVQELMKKRAAAFGRVYEDKKLPGKKGAEKAEPTEASKTASTTAAANQPRPKWTAEDERKVEELRTKMAKRPNRQANPALAETVTLEVNIAPDAAPGIYDLRLKAPTGVSNPMVLQVGELPEYTKPVVTSTNMPVARKKRDPSERPTHPQAADAEITLPIVVNGQILPGDVDRYRFTAKKGQHLTVAVNARTLIPYLADAVPGWFQATLALYDPQGREVAYSDSFRFSPDPVVNYEIPQDGTYAIEIKDSIYRGREDFVYRIAIGELPYVTNIFPLGGNFSEAAKFQLAGWNLPGNLVAMDSKNKSPGTFLLSVRGRGQLSNPVRFALDAETSCLEAEPNQQPAGAQPLQLPVVVDGRIERSGDQDVFSFQGKGGEEVVAEVFGRRLGSPLDSVLKLTDASGKQLATNDDHEDKGAGLMTHHADSRIIHKLPADGTYYLTVEDTQHSGGPEYAYRLRVGAPRPDFELRVVPSAVNVRAGTHVPITVYALRRDGFDGEIVLSMQDAPAGYWLAGARIPAGQDKVQLTLTGPASSRETPVKLSLVGAAVINGKATGRVAVPADDMMQAFAYHHLVPAREWLVYVAGRPTTSCRLITRPPLQIPLGGTARLSISDRAPMPINSGRRFNGPANRPYDKIAIELNDPPDGITVKETIIKGDEINVVISCDPKKVTAGLKGNLILNAFGERKAGPTKGAQRGQRMPLGSVPAVPFEVTAAPVASK